MSFSESLSATQNIDAIERRLRSINPEETNAEDALIVELAGRLAPKHPSPSLQAVSLPGPTDNKPMQPLELMMQRSSADEMRGDTSETLNVEVEAGQTLDFDDPYSCDPNEVELAVKKGSEDWKLRASALALGCMVMIGVLFDFAHGPARNVSLAGALVPTAAGAEQSPFSISGGTSVAASVNMPFVAAPIAAPPPMTSQFPDPQSVTATSLQPDRTPIATLLLHSATDRGKALQTSDAPEPTKRRPKAASETAGSAQPSNPKLGLPMKHLGKSTARIVLAEAGAIDPAAPAETPVQLEEPAKPENAPRELQAPLALPEPQSTPAGPPASAREPDNGHPSGELVSAVAVPVQSDQQRVDPSAATKSSGWAVQLAAPRSETEAESDAARLKAKYASALNGEMIGVSKAQVNGATVYRLRISGLSKSDAAALCTRVKVNGGNCFLAK